MAKTAAASTAYIAASTNRHSQAADVQGSLIAFGLSTLVGLWDAADANDRGVYAALPGHSSVVTCARFVSADALLTADDSGALLLWKQEASQWKQVLKKAAHVKAVSALAVYGDLIVTGASDSCVKIWKLSSSSESHELDETQTIQLKGRYPLTIALTRLPQSEALTLAIGGTDRNVQVWTCSEGEFVQSLSLAGHEDWVKSLAFRTPNFKSDPLVLASGSQDGTIRLWNIEPHVRKQAAPSNAGADALSDELLDAFEESLGELGDSEEGGRQISLKRHMLSVKSTGGQQLFTVTFDALLVGHEAGITSLSWRPQSSSSPEPTLLSTSTDSSVILWSPSTVLGSTQSGNTSLWINRQRFGDIGGQRLGGFVGGLWAREGSEVLAWGWGGGWRRWRCVTTYGGNEDWTEVGAITGHSAPVRGLSWSPNGEYLLSASLDQTTRVHGKVSLGDDLSKRSWHEISRPQVHGYDLVGVAFLDALRFVSIADEKVARVFEAPQEFVDVVESLHVADLKTSAEARPRAATVPPLGLSNKAVSDPNAAASFEIGRSKRRPFEGELAAFTLWPEIEKVFGHGYESITLAVSTNKKLAATACKATSAEHAVVRVYDTEKWQPVGEPLSGHTLTVTSVAFSPDDRFILSASRDRSWYLYERKEPEGPFVPVAADKSHARIIWDCAWAHEGDIFATASRDKTVKIWHVKSLASGGRWTPETTIKLPDAATAIAFDIAGADQKRRLAVGLESGQIVIFSSPVGTPSEWKEEQTIPSSIAHVGQIHQLSWRPGVEGNVRQLASCSEDGTLKVLGVQVGAD